MKTKFPHSYVHATCCRTSQFKSVLCFAEALLHNMSDDNQQQKPVTTFRTMLLTEIELRLCHWEPLSCSERPSHTITKLAVINSAIASLDFIISTLFVLSCITKYVSFVSPNDTHSFLLRIHPIKALLREWRGLWKFKWITDVSSKPLGAHFCHKAKLIYMFGDFIENLFATLSQ